MPLPLFRLRWLALLSVLAVALLTGCATPGAAPPVSAPATLAAGEGIVLLKVTPLQRVSMTSAKWSSLRLKETTTGRSYTLSDQASSGALYAIFSGAVPAGHYRVDGLDADGSTPLQWGLLIGMAINAMTSSNQGGEDAGTFTVASGRLTNLGLLLNAVGDTPANVVVADEAALRANLDDLDPSTRARLAAMPTLSWDHAPALISARDAAERLVRTRASRVSFDFPGDGRVLVGAPLGAVHERLSTGEWAVRRTGSADNINFVRGLADGRILAATDTGRCFVIAADGSVATLTVPGHAIVTGIEPLRSGGAAFLAQKFRGGASTLFGPVPVENHVFIASDAAELETAREMLPVPAAVQGHSSPAMFFDGRSLLVWTNHSGITRTGDLYRLDGTEFTVRKEETPFWGRGMYHVGSDLLVRERMNGLSSYADFSRDGGATWTPHDTPLPTFGARFVDADKAWGLDKLSTGWSTVTATLSRTIDGGKSWKQVGKPIELAGGALLRVIGERVYVFTGQELVSTVDEGANWQREWPRSE